MTAFACIKLWTRRFRGISNARFAVICCVFSVHAASATTGASIDSGEIVKTGASPLARYCDSRLASNMQNNSTLFRQRRHKLQSRSHGPYIG